MLLMTTTTSTCRRVSPIVSQDKVVEIKVVAQDGCWCIKLASSLTLQLTAKELAGEEKFAMNGVHVIKHAKLIK